MATSGHRAFPQMNSENNMKRAILLLALCATLSACKTPYQPLYGHADGGFGGSRTGPDEFKIGFFGNGFTRPERVLDFAALRASEITLKHGFRYFTVNNQHDLSSSSMASFTTPGFTTGTVTTVGNFTTFNATTTPATVHNTPILLPAVGLDIKCYKQKPQTWQDVFDAELVIRKVRAKYKMPLNAAV
jgi:hypothetical protein